MEQEEAMLMEGGEKGAGGEEEVVALGTRAGVSQAVVAGVGEDEETSVSLFGECQAGHGESPEGLMGVPGVLGRAEPGRAPIAAILPDQERHTL